MDEENFDEEEAQKSYQFYIDMIIHFQKLFNYTGDIQALLNLPYCIFQDLIVTQVKMKKEELEKLKKKTKQATHDQSFFRNTPMMTNYKK